MKLRYWLKYAIKNIVLFRCKRRYEDYCNAIGIESNQLPSGIDIGYGSYRQFLEDEQWILRRIYSW